MVTSRGSSATASLRRSLGVHAASLQPMGLESGPLAPWLVRKLRALELPVVCLDARQARAGHMINKSGANDAHGLAQIVRTGWYRAVEEKSIGGLLV